MKVYSDTFTSEDILAAALHARVGVESIRPLSRPRTRARGWVIRLTGSSRRYRNSGKYGAATWESAPATWEEHGEWMAFLFDIDPRAKIADYDGQAEFVRTTGGVFGGRWRSADGLRTDDDGNPIVDVVTCGHCGRSWNDALSSGLTPAPSGRCPFEYDHIYDETGV